MNHLPSSPLRNTFTRLALATTAITAAPNLACSPAKVQLIQGTVAPEIAKIAAIDTALDEEILTYTKKAQAIYAKRAHDLANQRKFEDAGWYFLEAGDKKQADEYFQKAAISYEDGSCDPKLEPKYRMFRAGHMYRHLGQAERANGIYMREIEILIRNKEWFIAAIVYMEMGKYEEAIPYLKREIRPDGTYIHNDLLGECYLKAGYTKEAQQAWMMAAKYDERSFGNTMRPWAIEYYRKAGMHEKADQLQQAMFDEASKYVTEFKTIETAIAIAEVTGDKKLYRNYGWDMARELEEDGSYIKAAELYEKIEDWKSAIRLYKIYLGKLEEDRRAKSDIDEESESPESLDEEDLEMPDDPTLTAVERDDADWPERENEAKAHEGIARAIEAMKKEAKKRSGK